MTYASCSWYIFFISPKSCPNFFVLSLSLFPPKPGHPNGVSTPPVSSAAQASYPGSSAPSPRAQRLPKQISREISPIRPEISQNVASVALCKQKKMSSATGSPGSTRHCHDREWQQLVPGPRSTLARSNTRGQCVQTPMVV